jgi:hypothetical protein
MDAYEIRLELLKLAQSIESERTFTERNRLEQDWHAGLSSGERKPYPTMPEVTYKNVVHVAEELNKFVSNKG